MAGKESDYRSKRGFIAGLPVWLKALFVKWWFGGAVFYFIGWGLFIQSSDQLDLTLVLGIALGLVTDLLINRALVFFENGRDDYRRYILCYSRRFFSLPVNLIYGAALSILVSYTYHFINLLAQNVSASPAGTIFIGAEPILYGLFFMGYDMLAVGVKNTFKHRSKSSR